MTTPFSRSRAMNDKAADENPDADCSNQSKVIPQKKGFNVWFVVLPVLALGAVTVIAGGLFVLAEAWVPHPPGRQPAHSLRCP